MAKRLAELGALQDAVTNTETAPFRLGLAGYIRGLFLDWSRNPSNPLTRLSVRGRYYGYFWDNGVMPLSMDFANQNYIVNNGGLQSASFSDIVTFSRTSNATITKSDGTIGYAPHNLLTYSEQFDNVAWVKGDVSVISNNAISPNGYQTADTITATTSVNGVIRELFTANGNNYTFSVWLRRVSGTGAVAISAGLSYVDVTLTTTWQRFTITQAPASGVRTAGMFIKTSGDVVEAWGAQLEIGSTATTYNPTTVKNLLGYTEAFDNAAWTKSNSFVQTNLLTYSEAFDNAAWTKTTITATANTIIAPNGYQTADTLAATGANSTALQTFTAAAVPYTYSVYLYRKTGTGDIDITVDGATWVTKAITAGWTRVDTTLTPAAGSKTAGIRIVTSGDEVYAWGAQLVQGSTAGDYRRTDAAALPVFYPNHNGVVCAEQIQSSAANGTALESYTATGGSMTFSIWMRRITGTGNVDITMDTGSTWTTQAITTDWVRYSITTSPTAGARTAGVRLVTSGDVIQVFGAMLGDSASLDPYVLNAAAAPTAQAYYGARFDYDPVTLEAKGILVEEQRSNLLLNSSLLGTVLGTQIVTVTAVAHTLSFYGTGTVTISGTYTGSLVGSGAYPARSTLTFTPTAGAITLTVTGTVQFAQLEIGALATSYIPTAASSVTRAADVAVIQGSNFYSWYNQNEGSIYVNWIMGGSATTGNVSLVISDGTVNNAYYAGQSVDPDKIRPFITRALGTDQVVLQGTGYTLTNGISYKSSGAYKVNDFAGGINGGASLTDTSGLIPIVDRVSIGSINGTQQFRNGTIKQITYYNTRLPDSTLQALTS